MLPGRASTAEYYYCCGVGVMMPEPTSAHASTLQWYDMNRRLRGPAADSAKEPDREGTEAKRTLHRGFHVTSSNDVPYPR